jgi:hypothetical protein
VEQQLSWEPSTGLSSTTGDVVTASPASTTTYKVTATGSGNCITTKQIKVTVNPLPILDANNSNICKGDSTMLKVSGASSYSWSPSNGLSTTTGNSIAASPTLTTTYLITGTDLNNCTSTKSVTVGVKELPQKPTIALSNSSNGTILLVSSSTSGNQWFKSDLLVQGATSQIFPITAEGIYSVQVTLEACTGPMSERYTITEVKEIFEKPAFWIYPNQADKSIKFNLGNFNSNEKIEVIIFDMLGRSMLTTSLWTENSLINISELAPDTYLLKLRQGNLVQTARFLKK